LAVPAALWLLWETDAGCLDHWAWTLPADIEAHEQAVGAAEAEDVCFAHSGGDKDMMWGVGVWV